MSNNIFVKLIEFKTATKNLFSFSPKKIITKTNSPEEYAAILQSILTHQSLDTLHLVHAKLSQANIEVLLSPKDWMEFYYQKNLKKINLKLDESAMSSISNSTLSSFIDSGLVHYENRHSYGSGYVYNDINEFKYFVELAFKSNIVNKENEKEIAAYITSILKDIEKKYNYVKQLSSIHRENIIFLKDLKSFFLKIGNKNYTSDIDSLVNKINQKRSVFKDAAPTSLSQNSNLNAALEEINQKSKQLDDSALFSQVNFLTVKAQQIIKKDWAQLSVEEQVKLKSIILKDLPDLIFNYLSIDKSVRDELVIKSSGKTLKESLASGFTSLQNDLNAMDKKEAKQEAAIKNIEVTSLHLNRRSSPN